MEKKTIGQSLEFIKRVMEEKEAPVTRRGNSRGGGVLLCMHAPPSNWIRDKAFNYSRGRLKSVSNVV